MLRCLTLRSVQISFDSALISASSSALIDLAVSTAEPEPATFVTLTITSKCSLPEPSRTGGQIGIRRTRPNAPSATLTATTMPPCQKPSLMKLISGRSTGNCSIGGREMLRFASSRSLFGSSGPKCSLCDHSSSLVGIIA